MAALMRQTGVTAAYSNGVIYYDDGTEKIWTPPSPSVGGGKVALSCDIAQSDRRVAADADCGNDSTPPDLGQMTYFTYTPNAGSYTLGTPSGAWFTDVAPGLPVPYVASMIHVSFHMSPSCGSAIAAAMGQARSVANAIVTNAPKYGSAMANYAQQAINKWNGTGLGVAAAAEFFAAVVSGIALGDLLALLAGVGITALIVYGIAECFNNN
jgi:hypothetical protein